ncbi:unnamed protein product [Linum trigynum]|uniref:Uncharacterized protein n=1 Tax=Linum trigynum TaxID=586398 RepID=A0AAV2CHR6_9ROSI
MEASTIHAGEAIGRRHHLLLTKPVSIKLLQIPLRLHKNLVAPNSHCWRNRPLHVGIARCHRGEFNAVGKHGHRRFKFKFRAKEEAEEGSSGKRRRTWWSDAPPGSDGGEEVDEEDEEELGILEDFIESLWILKVFKSYGWGLPFIIISWLLATGPKAFLMTLAIPLGQSAATLVFNRLWGEPKKRRPKAKPRAEKRKKPSASPRRRSDRSYIVEEDEQERKAGGGGGAGSGKMGYESWADSNGSIFAEEEEGEAKTQSALSSFGGWEELEGFRSVQQKQEREPAKGSQPQPEPQPVSENGRRQPQLRPRRRGTTVNGKVAWGGLRESSGPPLLLRLLIAVFPFLASWTKMF